MPQKSELFPKPPDKGGRPRYLTAKAWIGRADKRKPFQSHVTLGFGKVHTLSTETTEREKALDFNRAHLLARLNPKTAVPAVQEVQTEFL